MQSAIPYYIVAFNRIAGLNFALDFVEKSTLPLKPIILDMGSTWPSFLEYRDSLGIEVIKYPFGMCPHDLWTSGEIKRLGVGPFFLSDGDIDFRESPSNTFLELMRISEEYPWFPKIGLSLKISDIPDDIEGQRVKAWEEDNWKISFREGVYLCGTDTTIAYYPRRESTFYYRPSLRLGGEYTVVHYPWYERDETPTEESAVYRLIAKSHISTTLRMLFPTRNYLLKHSALLFLYRLANPLLKFKFTGELMIKLLSIRGMIRSPCISH
jgi:hypothetical protein